MTASIVKRVGDQVSEVSEGSGARFVWTLQRRWLVTVAEIHAVFIRCPNNFFSLDFMRDDPLVYSFTQSTEENTTVVKLTGPLTLSNMFEFQGELRALHSPRTIFDLTESEYMDSAGLGVLVNFYVSAEKNGRKMALAGVNERVEALLDMTHVKNLLRVYPTVGEAEAAI